MLRILVTAIIAIIVIYGIGAALMISVAQIEPAGNSSLPPEEQNKTAIVQNENLTAIASPATKR